MTRTRVKCDVCGKEVSKSNYTKHIRRHELHPESFDIPKYRVDHDGLNCQFCGKTCKNHNSLRNHERLCKDNPNRQIIDRGPIDGFNNVGHDSWNKGLTKDTDTRVRKISETLKAKYESGDILICRDYMKTAEYRANLSRAMKNVYSSNIPKVSGRSKQGWYKGFYCRSAWELAYLIYMLESNISIAPCNQPFPYIFEGESHSYFPDFYHPDSDTYIEIKGHCDSRAIAKYEQFPGKLVMLKEAEMLPIIQYVVNKYGENFTALYE